MSRTFVLVRSRLTRHPVRWVGLLLMAVAFMVGGAVSSTQAAEPWSVQVIGASDGGADEVQIDTLTFNAAKTALTTASADATPTVLPVAPTGFPGITTGDATFDFDATTFTLTVSGNVQLLGKSADMIVTAAWNNAGTDASPSVTVAFRTGAVALTDFAPALSDVNVGLSNAWTAFRKSSTDTSDLVVGDLPQAGQDFFDDGDEDSDDDLAIGTGVTFRGLVDADSAGLGDALGNIGVTYVRLDGTLSSNDNALQSGAPAPSDFALTATVGVTNPDSMPEWLELGSPWTIDLAYVGGDLTVGLEGGATATIGDTSLDVTAAIAVTKAAGGGISVDLSLDLDTVEAPFGAEWMTLESAALTASISPDGVSGTLAAEVTIVAEDPDDNVTGTVEITLAKSAAPAGVSATIDAELDGTISALDLAELVGTDIEGLPDDVDVTMSDLALYVAVDGSTSPKTLTVAATGTANVTLGSTSVGATMLIHSGPDGVIVAARPTGSISLSDFVGTVAPDPTLPELSVVVATADFETPASDLDGPTRSYFAGILCPDANQMCNYDLELDQGVSLAAAIELPGAITDSLSEIGLDATTPLKVTGHIPAFGGTTTSLTVELPGLTDGGDGEFVRGAGLDLEIKKAGSTVSFGLKGNLTVGIPRVESTDCPSGEYTDGGECVDEVEFSLTAKFAFTGATTSFELIGGLASASDEGWQQPFGIPYLTLHEAKISLGVTAGPTTTVDIGFFGSLVIGQTDINIGAKVGVMGNSPYLDFKGFTGSSKNGLSMRQLGKLYTEVSNGQVVPESIIPPVGIRNLFLSIGHVDDPDFCLRSGFYLSGDLYLDKGAPGGTVEPSCLPPGGDLPSTTDQCEADSDCLASVLIDIQTGKGGGIPSVNAQGFIAPWSVGPLSFEATIVKLNLGSAKASVFLKAGAELKDPIAYYSGADPDTLDNWASGSIKLEIGTQRLLVQGDVKLGEFLEAGISGSGSFDLTNPDFDLSVYLRAAFLDDIAAGIDEAIRAVNATADEFAAAFSSQNVEKVFTEIRTAFADLGNPGSATWQTLSTGYFEFRNTINSANDTLEFWGLGRPIPINQILDLALHGIVTPDIPEVRVCIIACFTLIPSINIPDIPGMCSYTPGLMGTPICTGPKTQVDEQLRDQYAAPVIKSEIVDAGLTMPAGVSVDTVVSKFAQLEPTSVPATRASRAVATGGTEIACAVAPVSYGEGDGVIGDTTFDVRTMGTVVTITGDQPSELAAASGTAPSAETSDEAEQDTFNALMTRSDPGGCIGSAPPPGSTKVLTLALDKALTDEGSALVASGRSVGGTAGQSVTVNWGDGATTNTTLGTDLKWSSTHPYADDAGPGTATTYTVKVNAPDHDEAVRQVGVVNVSPVIADLTMPTAVVNEAELSTVTGHVVDPGVLDNPAVVVDWGDGTAPESVPVVAGAFSITHRYADDNPSSTSSDVLPVSVSVVDKDRGASDEFGTQTVANTPAYGVTFAATNALIDGTTTFVRQDQTVGWAGTASDRSVVDLLRAGIDWGDDKSTDVVLDNNGTTSRSLAAEHAWTEPCVYDVATDVTDDDLGPAGTVHRSIVVTRPAADRRAGTKFWTRQFQKLAAGRPAALTPAQASCYLEVVRHVSTNFAKKVRVTTVKEASAVLSLKRKEPGQGKPSASQAKLLVQKAKLDRELLASLLDFTYGLRAWDTRVVLRPGSSTVEFRDLVALADQARSSRSLERVMALRRSLSML